MIYNFMDEKLKLKELLNNNKIINKDTTTYIILYIKHLKSEGKNKTQIRNELDALLSQNLKGFVLADWETTLRALVNKYTQKKFRGFKEPQSINVTKDELNFIKSFDDENIEKLLFVMLIVAKVNPQKNEETGMTTYWVNGNLKEIFRLAKYKFKSRIPRDQQRNYVLHDLAQQDIFNIKTVVNSNSLILNYCNSNIDENGLKLLINQTNYEELVYYYLRWKGYKIIECERCGKLVEVKNNNRTIYCKECARQVNIDKTKNRKV